MAVEFWYVNFNKFIYLLFMLVPSRSFQRQSNLMLSNAFLKSMKAIYTGLLNSIDFSMTCSNANM